MKLNDDNKSVCVRCGAILCEGGIENVQYDMIVTYKVVLDRHGDLEYLQKPSIESDDGGNNEMCCANCGAYLDIWDEELAVDILKEGK